MPFGDKNKGNRRYDDSGRPFKVSVLSVPTPDTRWEISFFSGSIECYPFAVTTGVVRRDIVADMTFYSPEDHYDPRPDTPKQLLERRPRQVASVGGYDGTLSRGNAVLINCGAGILHISWDFDEYPHPSIK